MSVKQEDTDLALAFNALAHPRRVKLFKLLSGCKFQTMTFGQLSTASNIPAQSLVHHLNVMQRGGLVTRRVKSRYTVFTLNPVALLPSFQRVTAQMIGPKSNAA